MDRKIITVSVLVSLSIAAILFTGCVGILPGPPVSSEVQALQDSTFPIISSEKTVIDANNRFAFDMYAELANDPRYAGENLFFSPLSVSSAVAIAYEGARGTTADEIRSAFHFPRNITTLREGYSAMTSGLNNQSAGYTLWIANALWAEKTYPFLPGYINTARQYYSANATNLDFINAAEDSRKTINQWAEETTNNKIHDLLPYGSVHSMTRLVITDAVYFKGTWSRQFDKNKTHVADFTTASGKIVRIPMMEKTDKESMYMYGETEDIQFIRMPYESGNGSELSMLFLLPKSNNLAMAEKYLDSQNLLDLQNSSVYRHVMIYIPKFTLETRYSLPPTLTSMGIRAAFLDTADISGMDGTNYLYIEDIIHKAYVDVNEEGTEAAAVTAVIMTGKGVNISEIPVPVFRADHPFVFLIQDQKTGTILFIGRVINPENS